MILGKSPQIQAVQKLIDKVAPNKINVLIIGESGTGKELIARAIHERGPLKDKPFVAVNCGAIPENLIESELFGHKKGSFTGAVADKPGLFEVANGGTLFLDEVGELPLAMQVKLLRAIQDRSFRRVGGNDLVKVDVRIIAATNRDLEAMVAQGTFREDLYYRLNVILIAVPPLRERKGDVEILIDAFLEKISRKQGKPQTYDIDPAARSALLQHAWPGNVRELENVIERAVTLATDATVHVAQLPPAFQEGAPERAPAILVPSPPDFAQSTTSVDLAAILAPVERAYWFAALKAAGGKEQAAGRLLKLTPDAVAALKKRIGA